MQETAVPLHGADDILVHYEVDEGQGSFFVGDVARESVQFRRLF